MENGVIDFLLRAKRATYAGKGAEASASRPSSHDLHYADGEWCYIDSYLGGERFAGEEALWRDGRPYWAMNYSGRVVAEGFSGDFLKEALSLVGEDAPFRGPLLHTNGALTYRCETQGDFDWFHGREVILCEGKPVYECLFHGGHIR
ncbi:MAG: DUF5680 domain-containing protein [Acetanaerobacterium sp.]